MTSAQAIEPAPKAKFPPQIPFIIGNEACERFSFYGMRNILVKFLISYLLVSVAASHREAEAKEIFHVFAMGVYFFPLLGGWLSDRYLGKYRTIFWLSLLYCLGHACLALFESNRNGFLAGLLLIALGSGGIKPCVSSFVGDQFDESNKNLARVVFDAFYWVVNFGSFFASLLIPLALRGYGPRVAFGIPGILMFVATLIFWAGRNKYFVVPPSPADPHSFGNIARTALKNGTFLSRVLAYGSLLGAILALATSYWFGFVVAFCLALVVVLAVGGTAVYVSLDGARSAHPDEEVDGVRAVIRVLPFFACVSAFWSLFDQKASTWIIQAQAMQLPNISWFKDASQMQAVNPALVMLLIPLNNVALYPLLRKLGVEPTPLRRMTGGIFFAGISWIVIGSLQLQIDGGQRLSILLQLVPYVILTFGEVLVSATGLEFAYSQAPAKMKSTLMSFWSLSSTVGNLWVLLVNVVAKNDKITAAISRSTGLSTTAFQMFFFAGFAFLAALAFGLYASRYKMVDYYRKS